MNKNNILIKTLQLIVVIILFYIINNRDIFLFALTYSLYNILTSAFSHISYKDLFDNTKSYKEGINILKKTGIIFAIIWLFLIILSLISSSIIDNLLLLTDTFLVFLAMGLSIISKPLVNLLSAFISKYISLSKGEKLSNIYYILESILLIITSFLFSKIVNVSDKLLISLLYLPKIISAILILILFIVIIRNMKDNQQLKKTNMKYFQEIKKVLTKNNYKSIINIVKNCFYYSSIVILYYIFLTRYNYNLKDISYEITFLYFYGFIFIMYLKDVILFYISNYFSKETIFNKMYLAFKISIPLIIIIGITAPLICRVIFNNSNYAIYLAMLGFIMINLLLYELSYEELKNKKVIYISLAIGLVIKIITLVPLINSFYRMGYNLIYGDIISTIIGFLVSIIINCIILKRYIRSNSKYFEKILKVLYENIILAIILIVIQFIIPIKTNNYFISLIEMILYFIVSMFYIKMKNKKRGL